MIMPTSFPAQRRDEDGKICKKKKRKVYSINTPVNTHPPDRHTCVHRQTASTWKWCLGERLPLRWDEKIVTIGNRNTSPPPPLHLPFAVTDPCCCVQCLKTYNPNIWDIRGPSPYWLGLVASVLRK